MGNDFCVRLLSYHGIGQPGQRYHVTSDETGVIVLMPVEMDAAAVRMEPRVSLDAEVSGTSQEDLLGVSEMLE